MKYDGVLIPRNLLISLGAITAICAITAQRCYNRATKTVSTPFDTNGQRGHSFYLYGDKMMKLFLEIIGLIRAIAEAAKAVIELIRRNGR